MNEDAQADFEEVFRATVGRATALAYRLLGDREAAEDVAAEALARACVRWTSLRGHPAVDAWILRTTANLAVSHVRRRRRPRIMLFPQWNAEPADASLMRLALADALRRLPKRQREAVALRYLADYSEQQVASAMNLSHTTVKTHLQRGMASLRSHLGAQDDKEVANLGL
jgi:RNA polymerase sigma-70 factor (ECF subfamily)